MTQDSQEQYSVEEVRDGREVSTLTEDYHDGDVVEFNCPSCQHSIESEEIMLEGGTQCPGCERLVNLHITSHDKYPEFRNVPKCARGMYR